MTEMSALVDMQKLQGEFFHLMLLRASVLT